MSHKQAPIRKLDTRSLAEPISEAAVLETFDILAPGEHFELVSEAEPIGLLQRFMLSQPGQFIWDSRMHRRDEWLVTIGRKGKRVAGARSAGGNGPGGD